MRDIVSSRGASTSRAKEATWRSLPSALSSTRRWKPATCWPGQGVQATVVNVSSVRPTDAAEICRLARATGRAVTVEEHSVNGGLGSLVAESLVEGRCAVPFMRLGIPDGQFAKAGPRAEIRRYYGIDAAGIVQAARRLLAANS